LGSKKFRRPCARAVHRTCFPLIDFRARNLGRPAEQHLAVRTQTFHKAPSFAAARRGTIRQAGRFTAVFRDGRKSNVVSSQGSFPPRNGEQVGDHRFYGSVCGSHSLPGRVIHSAVENSPIGDSQFAALRRLRNGRCPPTPWRRRAVHAPCCKAQALQADAMSVSPCRYGV
jgi:hypothetical protein